MSVNPLFAVMANVPSRQSCSNDLPIGPDDPCFTSPEYPCNLGGLYSDNIITPDQVKPAFYEQVVKAGLAQPSPLSEAFLSAGNVEYLRQTIENNLRRYANDPSIRFLLTKEFAQDMIDRVVGNSVLSYDVKVGVPALNDIIVHRETEIAELSLRHTKRYTRWALHNDRTKIMPYGLGDKTLHARGENQVSPAGYELNHPHKSQYRAYLRDVLHLNCPRNSQQPCQMPPFPIKFATP
jgi:hypothetical protein